MKADYIKPSLYKKLYSVLQYENVLVCRVSLETGMRVGDVVSLKPEQLVKRTIVYTAEKTGKPDKKSISHDLAERLKRVAGKKWIFQGRDPEKHRTRQAVWKDVKKACRELGISENVSPHSARKTYGVELFHEKGLQATQKALQHDNTGTTMIYAFADLLTSKKDNNPVQCNAFDSGSIALDIEQFADLVAEKVCKRLKGI